MILQKTVPQFLRKSFEGWFKREPHSVTSAMSLYPRCLQLKLLNNRLKYVGNHKIFGNIEICDCLTIDCVSHLRRVGTITRRNVRTSNELYSEIFSKICYFQEKSDQYFQSKERCDSAPPAQHWGALPDMQVVILSLSSGRQVVRLSRSWFDLSNFAHSCQRRRWHISVVVNVVQLRSQMYFQASKFPT